MWRALGHTLTGVLLVVAGFLVTLVGLFVSRSTVGVLGVSLPYGMVLVLACLVALIEAGRVLIGFVGAVLVGVAWLVGLITVMWPQAAGDVLVANDGYGIAFCLLGTLAVVGLGYRAWSSGDGP